VQPLPDRNRLLARLRLGDRERVVAKLTLVSLDVATVLFEPGVPVGAVYFPLDGVASIVTSMQDGAIVEVTTVGNEGLVGVPVVRGGSLAVRAISQVAGSYLTMSASDYLDELEDNPVLAAIIQHYVQALFGQISQAIACNELHSSEERLSMWLLLSHDRVGSDRFSIADEFLAQMLGSSPAAVDLCAGVLQEAGLIRYSQGDLEIVDRSRLKLTSCECYRLIRAEFDCVAPSPQRT